MLAKIICNFACNDSDSFCNFHTSLGLPIVTKHWKRQPMKLTLLVSISLLFFASTAIAGDCKISESEELALLQMPYQKFDQTQHEGWRKYEGQGCYNESALLLDKYLTVNKTKLLDWQIRIISWHAGQMFAFDNNYSLARIRFLSALNPNQPKDADLDWNNYVHATIAFLDKDMAALKLHRDAMADRPNKDANLPFVDGLIKCFDRPYIIAYSGCRE